LFGRRRRLLLRTHVGPLQRAVEDEPTEQRQRGHHRQPTAAACDRPIRAQCQHRFLLAPPEKRRSILPHSQEPNKAAAGAKRSRENAALAAKRPSDAFVISAASARRGAAFATP